MLDAIILSAAVFFAFVWTFSWFAQREINKSHFWGITEVIFWWILIAFFVTHPDISRLHLIWAAPITHIAGFLAAGLFVRISAPDE